MMHTLAFGVLMLLGGAQVPVFTIELERPAAAQGVHFQTHEGFLWRAETEDIVRPGDPIAHLGMWGTCMSRVETRLAPEVAARLRPFVFDIKELHDRKDPEFCFDFHPSASKKDKAFPRFLLRMIVKQQSIKRGESRLGTGRTFHGIDEITAVRLLSAERLSEKWMAAWERLNRVLQELVAASLEAPSPQKRVRLADLIEEGVAALTIMETPEEDEALLTLLRAIEPRAKVVPVFKERKTAEWRGVFERYIERLRIQPRTPLPEHLVLLEEQARRAAEQTLGEWLLVASSPGELVERAVRAWGPEALCLALPYGENVESTDETGTTAHWSKCVYVFMLQDYSARGFSRYVADARKQQESREKWKQEQQIAEGKERGKAALNNRMGLVLAPADDDWLAENLFLRAFLVIEATPKGKAAGFRKQDYFIPYRTVYGETMSEYRMQDWLDGACVMRDGKLLPVKDGIVGTASAEADATNVSAAREGL